MCRAALLPAADADEAARVPLQQGAPGQRSHISGTSTAAELLGSLQDALTVVPSSEVSNSDSSPAPFNEW